MFVGTLLWAVQSSQGEAPITYFGVSPLWKQAQYSNENNVQGPLSDGCNGKKQKSVGRSTKPPAAPPVCRSGGCLLLRVPFFGVVQGKPKGRQPLWGFRFLFLLDISNLEGLRLRYGPSTSGCTAAKRCLGHTIHVRISCGLLSAGFSRVCG